MDIRPVDSRVIKIMDIKCPGSGESEANRWENLAHLGPLDELKFVLADRSDYEWTRRVLDEFKIPSMVRTIHLSPVAGRLAPTDLAQWILADRLPVRLQVQLHKILWPGRDRGV
jgi:7-carboxy-7-deazaguanine synthase